MKNKTFKGDCLELMKDLANESIDMICTDLPYGTTKCKWDSVIDLNLLWNEYERIIKPNGAIILFAQTPFDKVLGASNLKLLKYEWIWEKSQATGHLNSKKMPMKSHENILVFYKKLPTYNPQMTTGHVRKVSSAKSRAGCIVRSNKKDDYIYNKEIHESVPDYDSTNRYPRSVLKFPSDKQKSALHPTQKPIDLIEYLIKTYSNEGDIILDSTAGSGTTAIACLKTNRNYILMEKDDYYYNILNERINDFMTMKNN